MEKGNGSPTQRLLILDTQPVWLRAVEGILRSAGFETVSLGSSTEALTALRRERFDILMVGIDGLSDWKLVLQSVRREAEPKVVVVGADEAPTTVDLALSLGADAYIVRRAQPEDIPFVVRQVLSPEVYEVRPSLEGDLTVPSQRGEQQTELTSREREILGLVARGRSNLEIARTLEITEPTVKGHLWRLYRKIGVSNRTAAARWATRSQRRGGD
jgi:DNA-binding NarL/FixJ family response regulator